MARLIGPALSGLLMTWLSEAVCFFVNGMSYLAVLAALGAMHVVSRPLTHRPTPLRQGLREGIGYTFGFPPIRAILLLLALVSIAGLSYSVLMPVYAQDVFQGGPLTLGLLQTASGVGALLGALYLAQRATVLGLGLRVALYPVAMGAGLIGFACSDRFGVALMLLIVIGFAVMVQMAASNTILQTIVDEDKRGRVMSFYTMSFIGMAPLGSLAVGSLAERFGVTITLTAGGACCIAGGVLFLMQLPALRARVRPIYVQKGILPAMAQGLAAASTLTIPPETAE